MDNYERISTIKAAISYAPLGVRDAAIRVLDDMAYRLTAYEAQDTTEAEDEGSEDPTAREVWGMDTMAEARRER